MTPFEQVLKELSQYMQTNLNSDQRQSCRLDFGDDLIVQLDLASSGEEILCCSTLGQLLVGTYRNNILKQALIVNALPKPPQGILAFSIKNDMLVLFHFFQLGQVNGESVYNFLLQFATHAKKWKETLKRGENFDIDQQVADKSGFMGLR